MKRKIFRAACIYYIFMVSINVGWFIGSEFTGTDHVTGWELVQLEPRSSQVPLHLSYPPPSFSFQLPLFPLPFFVSPLVSNIFPPLSRSFSFLRHGLSGENVYARCLCRHRRFSDPRRGKKERNIGPPRDHKTFESKRDDDDIAGRRRTKQRRTLCGEEASNGDGWRGWWRLSSATALSSFPPINYARGVDDGFRTVTKTIYRRGIVYFIYKWKKGERRVEGNQLEASGRWNLRKR